MSPQRRLAWSVLVIVAVLVVGSGGYVIIEGTGVFDAVYMTAITLSTVGFQEAIPLSRAGQAWTLGVIALGVVSVSVALTSLVAVFVSGELRAHFGSRRLEERINRTRDHVIICGYGRMGRLAAEELIAMGRSVVVIEIESDPRGEMNGKNIPWIIGDATEEETLVRAGLDRASALVSVLPHDADNVYVTLTAHGLCPDLRIVARAEQAGTRRKLTHAGAERVICPQLIGATRIAHILTRPHVTDFFEVASKGVELEMNEYVIGEHSALNGVSLRDSMLRQKADAMIVAIKRAAGQTLYNPPPESTLAARDTLIIIGRAGISQRLDALGLQSEADNAPPAGASPP